MEGAGVHVVYLWQNGMAMVFDGVGEQIPQLQGRALKMRDAILTEALPSTTFLVASLPTGDVSVVSREEWSLAVSLYGRAG